jgi:biotin synthase
VTDVLELARQRALTDGLGLDEAAVYACLTLPDERVDELLALAHEVRVRWCGHDVDLEGILSIKTAGCPEDCKFCSQSAWFDSPVERVRLDIQAIVSAAEQAALAGATEFCIVAAVRGPDQRLMEQVVAAADAIHETVGIRLAVSLGILDADQVWQLAEAGVHRVNHNLETAQSFFDEVVTTHSWQERWDTCRRILDSGMQLCCGGIIGMGETLQQRAEFATELARLEPHEVPLNFLDPRSGTPLATQPIIGALDALKTAAAFRLALPQATLRFAGGRELALGDLAGRGLLGGVNALIIGNYLTTLGVPASDDVEMLRNMSIPITTLGSVL